MYSYFTYLENLNPNDDLCAQKESSVDHDTFPQHAHNLEQVFFHSVIMLCTQNPSKSVMSSNIAVVKKLQRLVLNSQMEIQNSIIDLELFTYTHFDNIVLHKDLEIPANNMIINAGNEDFQVYCWNVLLLCIQ